MTKNAPTVTHRVYDSVKQLPGINALIATTSWKILRHRLTLAFSHRRSRHFTCFLRLPTQFAALSGPVVDFLMQDGGVKTLKITVLGCSTGPEPYSIASVLRERRPDLRFTVYAYDIDPECIKRAESGRYTPEEVFQTDLSGKTTVTPDFIQATFDTAGDSYSIKNEVRKDVQFDCADVLSPHLRERLGTSDIVYTQFVLIHFESAKARRAFRNVYRLLNPRAVLFIAGMDLHLLQEQTRKYNLVPLDYHIEQVYKEMTAHSSGWPWCYEALEPFMTVRHQWQRRYATVFLKT